MATAAVIAEQPIYDTEGEGGNYSLYQQVIGTGLSGSVAAATFHLRPASINGAFNTDLVSLLECDSVQMDVGCATFFSESHKLVEGGAPSFETFDFFPMVTLNPAKYYSLQVVSPGGWPYGGNPPYQTHIFGSATPFNGQPCMNCLNLSSVFFRLDDTYAPEERIAEQTTATASISQLGYAGYPTQSFTPTESGVIRSVAITAACGVMVSDGQFATARFDSGQSIPGGNRFTGGAFPVTAGQTYYITYLCDEIFDVISGTATDSYSGGEAGQAFMPGTGDIHFASNVSVGNALLDWAFTVCTSINCTLVPSPSTAPLLGSLSQFREFGVDPIARGAGFIGNAVVLKAEVSDADSTQVTLEVELKRVDTSFDGTNLHATTTVITVGATSTIALPIDELISLDDQYDGKNHQTFHWRARAVDAEGHPSEWVEYAPVADSFTANVVPLWTQVQSSYPSLASTTAWAGKQYASTSCSISACGCGIASITMIARYYGINVDLDGKSVDLDNANTWLKNNDGYAPGGLIRWNVIAEKYLGIRQPDGIYRRLSLSGFRISPTLADAELSDLKPVIARKETAGHFFVVSSKVAKETKNTYLVNDPGWYNTRTLDDARASFVRPYGNSYDYAIVYSKLDTPTKVIAAANADLYLASPAELLITDPQGRKAGLNPTTGTTHNEILGALYYKEGSYESSNTDVDPLTQHYIKVLHLPLLPDGSYTIKVIGTGEGSYALTSVMTTDAGTTIQKTFTASTTPNQVTDYQLVVSNGVPAISRDTISPEASVSFSTTTKSIVIAGTDDQSVPTVVTGAISSVITDASGNTLTLNLAQNVKQANYASLTIPSFRYSSGTSTLATTSLRYFWATDRAGKYTLLISAMRTPTGRQIAIYTALLGKTYIISSTAADDDADLSLQSALLLLRSKIKTYTGLYIPHIETQRGSVHVK